MKQFQVINDNNNSEWFTEPFPDMAFEHAQLLEDDGNTNVRVFEFQEGEQVSDREIWQETKK